MLRVGSLCTGYGGLDMAVEAYFNAETVWTCEFDKHASKVIEQRIAKPNHGDLKTTDWANVEPIDILTAGYPCQPFSTAGKRKGADDERHLWPYIKEIIRKLRPQYVVLENVRGHFGLGFREVLGDLASIGYDARWRLIRASDVGAPHRRERLFIVAYPNSSRWSRTFPSDLQTPQSWHSGNNIDEHTNTDCQRCTLVGDNSREERNKRQSQFIANELVEENIGNTDNCCIGAIECFCRKLSAKPRGIGNSYVANLESIYTVPVPSPLDQNKLNPKFVEYMMGLPDGWVTDVGLSRAQTLKILGNGVVPQQAYRALELLLGEL